VLVAALNADREKALALMSVSHETLAGLDAYVTLLLRWQTIKNLVGPATLPLVWTRHIADSAQLARFQPTARIWVDIGSGAGFPGLVLAILLTDRPGFHMHLIESNGRKVAFLREVARTLNLPVKVHDCRIEGARLRLPSKIDCLTARALAPLTELLRMQAILTEKPCIGLFLKGQDVDVELTEAAKYWNMKLEIHSSVTDSASRIIEVIEATPRV
jgi:16S rRNA (guanine527-N7)-methyltransferase